MPGKPPPYVPPYSGAGIWNVGAAPPCLPALACKVEVSGPSALQAAIGSSACGCEIVVAGGDYGDFAINKTCTAANPFVVRATTIGAAMSSRITVKGNGIIVAGWQVHGQGIDVEGSDNRIAYNELYQIDKIGIEIKIGTNGFNTGNRVDHNYLHDFTGAGVDDGDEDNDENGHEAIRVLTDGYHDAHTLIEYNLLDNVFVDGENEAISIKSCGNVVRFNTLANSSGSEIKQRLGCNNLFEGNYIKSSRGISVMGDGSTIKGNKLVGGSIVLNSGEGTMDDRFCADKPKPTMAQLPGCKGIRAAARNTQVLDNIAPIVIGDGINRVPPVPAALPASATHLECNSGPVTKMLETGTTIVACAPRNNVASELTPETLLSQFSSGDACATTTNP